MKFKQLIALAYAASAASLAVGLTIDYTQSMEDYYKKFKPEQVLVEEPTVMSTIVTVGRDLPAGHKLSIDDFRLTSWPADAVPSGAYHSFRDVFAAGADRFLRSELVEGEVLVTKKIRAVGFNSALSQMLPPGMRAVTIKINEVRGVGGFVQPNDSVDILLTELRGEQGGSSQLSSRVILQNIRILAMGQNIKASKEQVKVARSATVAVSLEDAQKLALATTIGNLSFALRNPNQSVATKPREISLADLKPAKPKKNISRGRMKVIVHRAGTF